MENKEQSAFPEPYINDTSLSLSLTKGLTKREYFAGLAMQGLMSTENFPIHLVAEESVKMADALLKELEK